MADKLKPCPFCGGDAYIAHRKDVYNSWNYHCGCVDCGAETLGHDREKEAIKAWNNRTSPWHTGTPTEDGLYLVYDKYCGYGKRELKKDISEEQLKVAFHDVLAWIPIEPCKED